jgi:hypothetical protein
MKKIYKILLFIIVPIIIVLALALRSPKVSAPEHPIEPSIEDSIVASQDNSVSAVPEKQEQTARPNPVPVAEEKVNSVLPTEINLKVPFTSQAPSQNWDATHEEFCAEASMLMAGSYYNRQTINGIKDAETKLQAIKKFEIKKLGYFKDTTAEETAEILRKYFEIPEVQIVYNPTINDVKTALAREKVIIVPLAGREIGNPNFTPPGPLYHMLLIKGYTKNGELITNDPGTRKGADYIYKEEVIMNAIHDWNGGKVEAGKRVMIVVG